jgi:hypothetical protein
VDDQLHAAGFVKEPLGYDGLLGGERPQQALGLGEILDQLMRCRD